jgi:hypothetical protein
VTIVEDNRINELGECGNPEGFADPLALAYCLNSYIEQHGDANQSFDVLRALVNLTIEWLERGKVDAQFIALNILTEACIPTPEGKSAGTRLSPIWNKLIDGVLPTREKGIQDFARNQGLKFYAWPEKDKSDGGRPSQYYLKCLSLPGNEISAVEPIEPGQIAYIRELTPEPSWWAKPLLKNGYRLEGWRRWLFLSYGVGTILFGAIFILLLWGLLWLTPAWSIKDLSTALFASAFFIFACWTGLYPFFRLLEWRIVMAPTGLVALCEINVQMEIVRDSQLAANNPGIIRLVRYASTCPQCKAKIEVEDGRKEFPNRLVGRCRENPGEHVYSFDRFTCKGKALR